MMVNKNENIENTKSGRETKGEAENMENKISNFKNIKN